MANIKAKPGYYLIQDTSTSLLIASRIWRDHGYLREDAVSSDGQASTGPGCFLDGDVVRRITKEKYEMLCDIWDVTNN